MEPTTSSEMTEVQSSAEFHDDIKQVWELCAIEIDTLEHLSVTDKVLYWCLDNDKVYPKLKELTVTFIGQLSIDYTRVKTETESRWMNVEQSVKNLELWLTANKFPALKTVRIQWAPSVTIMTIDWGDIEDYDRNGPIYGKDYFREDELMDMDAVLNLFCYEWKDLDWTFLAPLGITSLHLPFMLYDATDLAQVPFKVFCNKKYDEAAEDQVRTVLKGY